MINQEKKYELIKFEDGEFSLDVNVSPNEDTVWLTSTQMANLFNVQRPAIVKHISNIFLTQELDLSTCSILEQIQYEGKRIIKRKVKYYNLDMIISVGYRVNSKRGILFRKWATSILKQYLLKGITINEKRCLAHSDNLNEINQMLHSYHLRLASVEEKLDLLTNKNNNLNNKLFYENEIFDAYSYIKQLFLSANSSIILIDGYIDITVLDMLNDATVPIIIYTYPNAQLTNLDISKFSTTHNLKVLRTALIHDRFIIIDSVIFSIEASIKDAGKKRFVMTKIETISINDLLKNIK